MAFYVYKYVENNEVIYIGQTMVLNKRIKDHTTDKLFNFKGEIYYYICNNRLEMDALEYFLITKYHPKYNDRYNESSLNWDLTEPEWIKYDKDFKELNIDPVINNTTTKENLPTASEIDDLPYEIQFTIDVQQKLRELGYGRRQIRETGLVRGGFFTQLNKGIVQFSPTTLKRLCLVFNCQPGELIELVAK